MTGDVPPAYQCVLPSWDREAAERRDDPLSENLGAAYAAVYFDTLRVP